MHRHTHVHTGSVTDCAIASRILNLDLEASSWVTDSVTHHIYNRGDMTFIRKCTAGHVYSQHCHPALPVCPGQQRSVWS